MTTAAAATPTVRADWPALRDAASAPYRSVSRFAWHFARGKLGMDPVFRHLLTRGLIAPHTHILDIGCGQGLLASLLRSASELAREGRWPSDWAAAPIGTRVTGIELMPREVQRARAALGDAAECMCGDMRRTPFPQVDTVVIFDVLHYVAVAEQDAVLARVREALPVGGHLLMRVGDASAAGCFRLGLWIDALVAFARRREAVPQFGRALPEWIARLEALGFDVTSEPMNHGTPFANVLLFARVCEPACDHRVMNASTEALA